MQEGNISGSRFDIWVMFLQEKNIFKYLFLGEGTQFFIDGERLMPHSGHLHLIYGYGFIFYLLFCYMFFPFTKAKKKSSIFILLVILVIFTMNTVVGDLRVLFSFTIVISLISTEKTKNEKRRLQ